MNVRKLPIKSREQWLEARRLGITGTDIAAIIGESSYRSPLAVYLDKVEPEPPGPGNEAMWLGSELEDPIAKLWQKKSGVKVRKINAILQHPKHLWMLGNIDRHIIAPKEGILEIKLVGPGNMRKWDDDQVPRDFWAQVMWYMLVTGIPYAKVVGLLGGVQLVEREIEYDREVGEALLQIAHDCWHHNVLQRVPPAIDGSNATTEALNRMFNNSQPVSVQVPHGIEWIALYKEAEDRMKAAEADLETAKNNLKFLMGDHEVAYFCGQYQTTWKSTERKSVDTKRLKAELPGIYEQYATTSAQRRFTIKEMK
jgi:putative phage-type endonuclease